MKLLKVLAALAVMSTSGAAAYADPDPASAIGIWESDKRDTRMSFFQDGNLLKGKLLWGNKIVQADGITSKKDIKNPDANMRSRDLVGITSLTGLKWDGHEYVDGKIYDPQSGRMYTCKMWVTHGKMHLHGYLGLPAFGQTVDWHKYTVAQ